MIEKRMLFSPGPVLTSDRVKSALIHPDMCHRHPMFERIVENIRANLLTLFGADQQYTAVIVSGSGTAANETALSSIIRDSDEVLLIKNGEFGERLDDILSCYNYKLHVLGYPWGTLPDLETIEAALAANERIQWVCVVFHETSTGMRNPVREIGRLVARHGRKFFVDCVSAVGGEDIDVVRDNVDVCTGTPNKALGGLPGASFVVARRSSVPALGTEVPRRNIYLNLQRHIAMAEERNQTPNTPSVTMFVALDAALEELMEEGLGTRIDRYRRCAQIIRDGVRALGLRTLLPDGLCANTVTSVFLPDGLRLDEFIDEMDSRGYVIYPGKRHLYEQNMFQIANMGRIEPEHCRDFLRVLEETLESMGFGRHRESAGTTT
ncbi:MAG: alanine--glyoxylate aminotransferase family protein [Anaerolineae bacterium]|nr:alanine--glyoxylate aminotransferase family protein [Anaerolineae bacterium]